MSEKTFDPARPRYTLPLAGKDYELLGTLELVEAVENAFREGVSHVTARCVEMGVTETGKLLAAMLNVNGHKVTPKAMGEVLFSEVGINSDAFRTLQLHLYSFLRIVLEPPEMREKMAKTMGEMMGTWTAPAASPGKRTRRSA